MWTPALNSASRPLYLAIADALEQDIRSGALSQGVRLPTHRALAQKIGCTVGTVTRAYEEAARRGLIAGEVGRGSFVRQAERGMGAARVLPERFRSAPSFDYLAALHEGADRRFEMSVNYPVPGRFAEFLSRGLQSMLADPAALEAAGTYQQARGMQAHREAASAWLAHLGVEADPDAIVVSAGCQNGLFSIFLALSQPGDVLLAEELTWPGLRVSAEALGMQVKAVGMDMHGVRPEDFERACRDHAPRFFYTIPTLHNPTALIMPTERRREIARIAERHGVLIIEDDVYGFLVDGAPPPLRAFAPEHAVYVTSLSKIAAPGLRVGYVAAPPKLLPPIEAAIRANMLMTSPIAVELASRLIADGVLQELMIWRRDEARVRQRLLAEHLPGLEMQTHPAAYHAWVRVPAPMSGDVFIARLLGLGVALTPGEAFAAASPEVAQGRARLCIGAIESREHLVKGLRLVADVARVHTGSPLPVV